MQKTKTATKEITKESRDLMSAREIATKAKENGMKEDLVEMLNREGYSIDHKMAYLIIESLNQLALVKAVLHNEDMFKLEGYELAGVTNAIDEVNDMLTIAAALHMETN